MSEAHCYTVQPDNNISTLLRGPWIIFVILGIELEYLSNIDYKFLLASPSHPPFTFPKMFLSKIFIYLT